MLITQTQQIKHITENTSTNHIDIPHTHFGHKQHNNKPRPHNTHTNKHTITTTKQQPQTQHTNTGTHTTTRNNIKTQPRHNNATKQIQNTQNNTHKHTQHKNNNNNQGKQIPESSTGTNNKPKINDQ